MNGPEHYKAAEKEIGEINGKSPAGVNVLLKKAQVHATLALAAATVEFGAPNGPAWERWSEAMS